MHKVMKGFTWLFVDRDLQMVHMDLRLLAKLYDIVKLNKNEAPVVLAENFTSTGDSFNYGWKKNTFKKCTAV